MAEQDLPHLDDSITKLPQDVREDLAERGRRDLYFLAKGVLGYRDMTPRCHGPLCVFHDGNPSRFKMTLHPRGTFKTSVVTISKNMQRVCRDSNRRILLANESATNAERFLGAIKQHVETNSVFRALYSSIIPKDFRRTRWSQSEVQFVREWVGPEPTIDTVGMTGAMTSRHYTDISVDDPISEEAAKSELVMRDVITRLDKIVALMVKPEEDNFDLTGTRWAYFDVYSHFEAVYGKKMARFIRGIYDEDGNIFPELLSEETLADARRNMGEYMFSCLYLNNPRNAEVQDFNVQDLRFWRWSTDEDSVVLYDPNGKILEEVRVRELDVVVTIDVAPPDFTANTDRNAIVTTGVTPKGDVVVLDTWAKRCPPGPVIDHMLWLKRRYNPRVYGLERATYQMSLKYHADAEAERQQLYMNIVPVKPGGREKAHIRGLQPIAATGHLYILPTQHDLRNELADYPLGKHDDVADALALQQQLWRGVASPERWLRTRKAEQALLDRRRVEATASYRDSTHLTWEQQASAQARGRGRLSPQDIPHPDDLDLDLPQPTIEEVEVR